MNNIPAYKTESLNTRTKKVQYLFESTGNRSIIKVIEYTPVARRDGRTIYNLGFGDYDEETGTFLDDVNSNNGDMWKVFSTVLNTVPVFFRENKKAAIWVQGSDSAEDYKVLCEPTCNKKCNETCRNFNRRIKTYRYYVNKHFVDLSKEYVFFGLTGGDFPDFVQYVPGNEYIGILIFRKK
ncbi:hypothetical protein POV27_05815 [Aureisphaera galaxeae]|uniref:DUF6934 family protein n=1 Tax=Aureisphaera galaxeae TaxID=1538023 RepID=UPI002350E4F3|nr:hypothetical protein [Aureisphaera galaxeae]MDC8003558.1 hypothetical protein [Aureisphaera galaxeae]